MVVADGPIISNMPEDSTGSAHLANILNSTTDKELLPQESSQVGSSGTAHKISGHVKDEEGTPPPLNLVCSCPFYKQLGITISITADGKTSQETVSLCIFRCNTT